jgi:hypothetical protein
MSNCWDLDFSAAGPEPQIEELKAALPELKFDDGSQLFHRVDIVHATGSFVVIDGARNYHGIEAICELVARFPDLTFHGSAWCQVGQDSYWVYQGNGGETTVREFVMPDFDERLARVRDPAEIQQEIGKICEKISRLEAARNLLNEDLVRVDEKPKDREKALEQRDRISPLPR